jgi:LmbE family N-acetylglucosaminyl deacetylase
MDISERSIIYVPDGIEPGVALARTTHMAIVAHQDDAEIIAHDIISQCFDNPFKWFTCVIVSDGAGSTRKGKYSGISPAELVSIRNREQKEAARVGDYGALVLMGHPSSKVKRPGHADVTDELVNILKWAKPDFIYTHNPFDHHDTHVAVMLRTLDALRRLSDEYIPEEVYGCEVWRSLDWLLPEDRIPVDVSLRPELAKNLLGIFESQIGSGKRYDLAVLGRRLANATFDSAVNSDATDALAYSIDLKPLVDNPGMDVVIFARRFIDRFKDDVISRIEKLGGV